LGCTSAILKSTSGKIGFILVIAIVLLALLAPVLHPYDPAIDRHYLERLKPPSLNHWFGTEGLGRDLLVLVWYGLRTSLLVGLVSVLLGLVIGVLLGLVAGYFRGWLETVIGWLTDIL
jgi:peptide/nickel transport system permease protein